MKLRIRFRLPDDQALATHSVNRGIPLTVSHRNSGLARAVNGFAVQLAEDLAPSAEAGRDAGGVFSRLFGRAPAAGA
jgi:pilus assembly protein CpaE